MAEKKPRARRITRGDTFTFCRDERTGEVLVRCLFCEARYPMQQHWLHVCPKTEEKTNGSKES